jgi:beta-lactamase class A
MATNSSARRRPQANSRRRIKARQQEVDRAVPLSIHLIRLIIFGLGTSAVAGTTISIFHPPKPPIAEKVAPPKPAAKDLTIDNLHLTRSNAQLQAQLQAAQKNSKLDASYLFIDAASGEYSASGADRPLPAASTIKLPILIALFQDVDRQKVRLDEQLTIDKKSIAEGSGDLQDEKPGTQVSILTAATKMMTISDNTATNLILTRLGGKTVLNQRFRDWGLKVTTINNQLPDLEGTNITTASELARSIHAVDRANILSDTSRSQILRMMSSSIHNTMLPQGLSKDAKIAHKTGDIGTLVADVGKIELPSGRNYIAAVIVKRPHNNPAGPELVRTMSQIADRHFRSPPNSGFPSTEFIKRR